MKTLPSREKSEQLLKKYVKQESLLNHCHMVALAMQAYAKKLGEDEELWYQTGLLHDIDFEQYPDEHPIKGPDEILIDYPDVMRKAIKTHGPDLSGMEPETLMERYLFACDEISGLMHATALMRPNGFKDMKYKSVKKKIKDKSFAAKINRDDIQKGLELIKKEPVEHVTFLIEVFRNL